MSASITSITHHRHAITSDKIASLNTLFKLNALPLALTRFEADINNVPTEVVSAIRRVLIDEIPNNTLRVPLGGFKTMTDVPDVDVFMLPQFVNNCIAMIRIRRQIPESIIQDVRFKLDVRNTGFSPLKIYSGDLVVSAGVLDIPIFNPTSLIAIIQPGKRLLITDIQIVTGIGRDDGLFNVACQAAFTHTDLEEYTDEEIRKGEMADYSGYKLQSTVADPRQHRLFAVIPATSSNSNEIYVLLTDVCSNIVDRVHRLLITLKESSKEITFTTVMLDSGMSEGTLQIAGESHTIGALLRRIVYDQNPGIDSVAYLIDPITNVLKLTIKHSESAENPSSIDDIMHNALIGAIALFENLKKSIEYPSKK
jgi:DNA-directed RNA polymerase subunit L